MSEVLNNIESIEVTTVKEMENGDADTEKIKDMGENEVHQEFQMEYGDSEDQFEKEYDDNEDVETTSKLKNLPDDAKVTKNNNEKNIIYEKSYNYTEVTLIRVLV